MRRLQATGLRVSRGGRLVLADLDVEAAAGQLVAVVGPSGSGKSTLLEVLAGDRAPLAGTVLVDGERVLPGDHRHAARCGRVLQRHGLLPALTAAENVELVLRARGVPGRDATERAEQALGRVGLADARDRPAGRLSGGQQQRVSVARALAGLPELVLADEPTSELDEVNRDAVVAQLRREADRGALVLVATHDAAVAEAADVRLRLGRGRDGAS